MLSPWADLQEINQISSAGPVQTQRCSTVGSRWICHMWEWTVSPPAVPAAFQQPTPTSQYWNTLQCLYRVWSFTCITFVSPKRRRGHKACCYYAPSQLCCESLLFTWANQHVEESWITVTYRPHLTFISWKSIGMVLRTWPEWHNSM